jgi:hypothetical protein
MSRNKHSRAFWQILAERTTDPAKKLEAEKALKSYEAAERRESRTVQPAAFTPGDELWLNEWLERAAEWLVVHFQEQREEEERYHVRLRANAPAAQLATETRLRISRHHGGYEVLFPCKASRAHAVAFLQARIGGGFHGV